MLILLVDIFFNGCKKEKDEETLVPELGKSMYKIAFASDLHYMAPELLVQDGPAFQSYLATDPKLLADSRTLLQQLITQVNTDKPDLFIVSGDLTKDGELVSHQQVIELLHSQLDPAIKVLLVPGNHDIANPAAMSFDGANTASVPTVTADEFVDLYRDFGYATAKSRDAGTLSYVAQPYPNLRVIFIDTTIRPNPDDPNETPLNGEITEATLNWITLQAAAARLENMEFFAVMHHNLMSHWTGQSTTAPGYVLDNMLQATERLSLAGITTIFTGHAHNNDIVKYDAGNIFDIETGSLVSYPLPYRLVNLWHSDSLQITTKYITGIELHGFPVQEYAENFLDTCITNTVKNVMNTYFLVPDSLALPVAQSEAGAYLELCKGDELLTPAEEAERDAYMLQLTLAGYPLAAAAYKASFDTWNTDLVPQDNNLSILPGK